MRLENSLKVWRAVKNITQAVLASEIGISRQTINAIEKGKLVPSVFIALRLAAHFDTRVEEIFVLIHELDDQFPHRVRGSQS
ncbi:MAG: transcriptional regulator [Calditrichales bacterium]|nr:MAG: transcriptional regulator [Calditrichales bacterium]